MLVTHKGLGLLTIGTPAILFKPGVNSITSEEWTSIKDHPVIKIMQDEGTLVVIQESSQKKTSTPEDDLNTLKAMKPPQAIKMVEDCIDLPLLKRWAEKDTRPTVQKSILARIHDIESPPVYRDPTPPPKEKE